MRNVAFHVDRPRAGHPLRPGSAAADGSGASAYLDDKHSFVLDLDTARIGISPAALSQVLNRYTFNYPARRSASWSSRSITVACASTGDGAASRSTWSANCC